MGNETGPSVQKQLEDQGLKRTPRTWIDDAQDALESQLESRLSKNPLHPYTNSEFRNWILMQNEILDSLKKLNEFNAFLGHRFVQSEIKRVELERASKDAIPTLKRAERPKNVTSIKSST